MAYTPINWQNGDTITAEKMNKMDNGWSYTAGPSTQIFSETVITENDGDFNVGELSYATDVADGNLLVTFDGVDYNCVCADAAFGSTEETFEDYPFYVYYSGKAGANFIETATAGSHTITVSSSGSATVEISDAFKEVVGTVTSEQDGGLFLCESNVTTKQEMEAAWNASKLLYFAVDTRYIITSVNFYSGTIEFMPTSGSITAGFDIFDKFYVES